MSTSTEKSIGLCEKYGAKNYHPLDIVISRAKGIWVYDPEGKKYLDMLSAYSAVNQGHCHPRIVETLKDQADKVTLTSRAFHNGELGPFLEKICKLSGMDLGLPMNSGAEAVETAVKTARKWGYEVKGVESDKAEIIVCANNFHGRTTTIVGFSTEEQYRHNFGPFASGFKSVRFGDREDLRSAINKNTVAFLVEPIQGEGGVNVPPVGYLWDVRSLCSTNDVLLIADEIQTGFGRTGYDLACQIENIQPDIILLGKALGGGVTFVSAVVANAVVMDVMRPGDHGSTFGGNPLACAVGIEAVRLLKELRLSSRAREMGKYFKERLSRIKSSVIREVRGRGLMIGIEVNNSLIAKTLCEQSLKAGVLCTNSHNVIRISPPLIISKKEADWGLERIENVFANFKL